MAARRADCTPARFQRLQAGTLPDTLGPGVDYGGRLLVPVRDGVAVVDGASGRIERTLPVPRDDPGGPVTSAALGDVLVEQRGTEVVALRPSS